MSTTQTETRLLGNYIGGRWVPSTGGAQLDVTNPATGERLARVPLSGAPDVDAAVAAARAAFPAWRSRSTIDRARWLFGFRQVLEAHQDDVARSIRRALERLPEAQRRVVVLKLFEGRRFAEIARLLGTTEAASRNIASKSTS